jgi:hypothetical protein
MNCGFSQIVVCGGRFLRHLSRSYHATKRNDTRTTGWHERLLHVPTGTPPPKRSGFGLVGQEESPKHWRYPKAMGTATYIYVACKFCKSEVALQEIHPEFRLLRIPSEEFAVCCGDCELELPYDLRDVKRKKFERIPDFGAHPNFPRIALATVHGQTPILGCS